MAQVDLNTCDFTVVADSEKQKNAFVFKDAKKKIEVSTRSPEERAEWTKLINQARKSLQKVNRVEMFRNFGKALTIFPTAPI